MSLKNVVLVGASGNLGELVLKELLLDPTFNVTAVSRESSNKTFPDRVKVANVPDDYPDAVMRDVFTGQNVVIFAVGFGAAEHQKRLIDVAAAAGVKRWIPTEFGSNSRNAAAIDVFPILGHKAQLNSYLQTKEAEGLTWTAISCGPFFDYCLKNDFLGFDLRSHKATISDSGDFAFSATTLPFLARAVVAVLQRPEETANQYLYVSSFETTANEILASLEKNTGQKFEVEHVKSDDMIAKGREELKAGNMMEGLKKLIIAATCRPNLGSNYAKEETLANGMLGLEQENVDIVIRQMMETAK